MIIKHNACIVGGGSIGALKPEIYDNPSSKNILTHAHALYHLRKNKLINNFCVIDPDKEKRKEIEKRWKCRTYKNLDMIKQNMDIFIVSVPTNYHKDVLKKILKFDPKIVIAEKPFCKNYNEANEIHHLYKRRDIPIVVNYVRRFSPMIQTLKQELQSGKYGKIKACNIIYVRGLHRDASHAIDLCNYFFGEFCDGKILGSKHNGYDDFSKNDLTVPVWMEYRNCNNIYLTPADGRDYSIFEFDILTENARICLIDHSKTTKIYYKEPEKVYGNFNSMCYESLENINNDLESATIILHANVNNYLQNPKKDYDLFCTSLDALKVQNVLDYLEGEER
jgi:predicted dehydrogenase